MYSKQLTASYSNIQTQNTPSHRKRNTSVMMMTTCKFSEIAEVILHFDSLLELEMNTENMNVVNLFCDRHKEFCEKSKQLFGTLKMRMNSYIETRCLNI